MKPHLSPSILARIGLALTGLALVDPAHARSWLQPPAQPSPPSPPIPGAVSGTIEVGSATLTLPPGPWRIAARENRVATAQSAPVTSRIQQVVLFQTEAGRLAAILAWRMPDARRRPHRHACNPGRS